MKKYKENKNALLGSFQCLNSITTSYDDIKRQINKKYLYLTRIQKDSKREI